MFIVRIFVVNLAWGLVCRWFACFVKLLYGVLIDGFNVLFVLKLVYFD